MKNHFCGICAGKILQKQSIIRVVVERAKKVNGDSSDPAEWSSVEDWEAPFLFHAECVLEAMDNGTIFNCRDICGSVLLEDGKKAKRHLRLV